MAQGLIAAIAGVIALLLAGGASAQCTPTPPPLIAHAPADTRFVERYNALAVEDPYLLSGRTEPRWRMLADDLKSDGHASPGLVARSLMMLAGSLQGDDAIAPGLRAAQDALAFAEADGITDGSLHAALLTMLAGRETQAGKTQAAVRHVDTALAETEKADGRESWAYGNAALEGADAHFANGDYAGAERLAADAERLAIACLSPDVSIVGAAMQSHAAVLSTLGRTDEALELVERALVWDVAHLPESDPVLADALADLGFTLRNANRLREAEAVMRRALDLNVRYRPDDAYRRAETAGKLGNILAAERKYREAEAMFLATLELYGRTHNLTNPLAGSGELRRAGDAAQEQGKLAEALDLRRRAVSLIESRVQPRHPELARTRIELATTLAVAGHTREALSVAEPAVTMLRETAPPGDFKRMGAEIAYAAIAGAAGVDPAHAYAIAAPVAKRMEEILLDAATSRGDLIRFAPTFSTSFAVTAKLALRAHEEEAAFHGLQLANLSEIVVVNADVTARAAADPQVRALIERRDAGAREHRRLDRDRLAANARGDVATVLSLDAAIGRVDDEGAATTRELDRAFPAYRSLSRPQPVTLAAWRAQLKPGDVMLAPLTLPGDTLVVAVTREGLRWTTTAAPRARVIALVERIRGSIDASRQDTHIPFDTAAARALATILLPPALMPTFGTHHHLVYYASGPLATVPPSLLVTAPTRRGAAPAWLIRSHSVSIATTLSPRITADRMARNTFLGIGAPALGGKPLTLSMRGVTIQMGDFGTAGAAALPPLPHAANELRAMGAMFPPGQKRLLIGPEATKSAFRNLQLDRYGVIAFATHGLVADALPGLTQPALVLTPVFDDHSGGEALLTAGEIAGLHLDADWVILSACDTAGGSDPQSGSYSGLTSAFIQAGARALLVSHWPVRDDAAERLTVATVRASRHSVERATALQHATLALMRDRSVPGASNPAVWAPFVLVE